MNIITLATSLVPDTSAGFSATLVIAGFGTVLAALILLIIIIKILFDKIISKTQGSLAMRKNKKNNKKMEKEVQQMLSAPAPVSNAGAASSGVSGEVVAAISAAVYMMEGEGAIVSSITPAAPVVRQQIPNPITRRNPWAMAAVFENTKPLS